MAEKTRKWQPRELRLVSEYVAANFPEGIKKFRVRLGTIHPGFDVSALDSGAKAMLTRFNRWADAVVILPDRLIIIEATIPPRAEKVAQLEMYEQLLTTTPEFEPYLNRRVEKLLVMGVKDPTVEIFARQRGIKVVVFVPEWLPEYLKERSRRWSSPTRGGP